MIHLTFTGPYAGTPFCNCNKEEEIEKGNTFQHVPYSNAAKFFETQAICPECKNLWFGEEEIQGD